MARIDQTPSAITAANVITDFFRRSIKDAPKMSALRIRCGENGTSDVDERVCDAGVNYQNVWSRSYEASS